MVGLENANKGIDANAYFPSTVYVHVGDTVHWMQNSNEIRTVTFLVGTTPPDLIVPAPAGSASPIMLNPDAAFPLIPNGGLYDGTTEANSGIMGLATGQAREFSLTFTEAGTYDYLCLVHDAVMSGEVVVVGSG